MKKKEKKVLSNDLIVAMENVFTANCLDVSAKIEKAITKAVKKLAKVAKKITVVGGQPVLLNNVSTQAL